MPKDVLEEIDINNSSKTKIVYQRIVCLINPPIKVQNPNQTIIMETIISVIEIIVVW